MTDLILYYINIMVFDLFVFYFAVYYFEADNFLPGSIK